MIQFKSEVVRYCSTIAREIVPNSSAVWCDQYSRVSLTGCRSQSRFCKGRTYLPVFSSFEYSCFFLFFILVTLG